MFNNIEIIKEIPHLEQFAFRLCRSKDDADDLVQASLLRAMEKKHLFQADTDLFRWTCKIMYNLFVSDYRRRKKFESQADPEHFIKAAGIEPRQDRIADYHKVEDAMEQLGDEHRTVLILVCVRGMRYKEIAEMFDIPLGTVRSRLSRARENLKTEIEKGVR